MEAPCGEQGKVARNFFAGVGRNEVEDSLADEFFFGCAMNLATGGIDVQNFAVEIFNENGVWRAFEKIVKAHFAEVKGLFGVNAFERAAAVIGEGLEGA